MNDTKQGRHLIINGFTEKEYRDILCNETEIETLLNVIIQIVNMTILIPARGVVIDLDQNKKNGDQDCGGVTATAVLTTSHISIHTWPLHDRFSFDLYSCKDFDARLVQMYLKLKIGMCGGEIINMPRSHNSDLRKQYEYTWK